MKIGFKELIQSKLILTNLRYYLKENADGFGLDIKPDYFYILFALYAVPTLSQEKISYYLGFDRATTSRILDKLENNEILTRNVSSNDNRIKEISLSEKGISICKKIEYKINDWFNSMIDEENFDKFTMKESLQYLTNDIAKKFNNTLEKREKDERKQN